METYSQKLLEQLKQKTEWSYYRIAAELDVTRGNVSRWKSGGNGMSDDVGIAIAKILKIDPEIVLTNLQIQKTDSDVARRIWRKHLKSLNK